MTLYEYDIRMTASSAKRLDERYARHEQAWINNQVKGTKKKGKGEVPLYPTFKKFFDYEKFEKEILEQEEVVIKKDPELQRLLNKANS